MRAASATARSRATLEAKVVTATRPLAAFTSSVMVLATSASDGERPSRTALVESPISASTPASPSSRNRRSSVGTPMIGVGSIFQSPVCSTVPAEVWIASAWDSGIECAFSLEQRGAEFCRIDRAFQLRPQIHDGAEMVFVGMGQHQADEILALLFEKADIGHDQIDARQMLLVAKRHAEIDREPGALVAVAKTVDRQVHADLANAAERRKGQFIRSRHQAAPTDATEPK